MSQLRMRHRFSVRDYEQMIAHGILDENRRIELMRGEIVEKMPIEERHVACVNRLTRLLTNRVGEEAIVSIQNPVLFADSAPEPDAVLLRPREDFYETRKPRPADVLLLIEVADTSLEGDRAEKGSLYAEGGVPEYWIVNLTDDTLEVRRQPRADGTWGEVRILQRGDRAAIAVLPDVSIAVAEML